MASHNSSVEQGTAIYAPDMEAQIAAEARGVMRKNIPWDAFHSTYLCDFNLDAQSKLAVESVKKIGEGDWGGKPVRKRLRKVLSAKVRCSGSLLHAPQSSVNLLSRFFVTLSYSMAVPRLYPMPIRVRRCLLNPTSFSTSVKGLLRGRMWSFCSSIRRAEKQSLRNSRSGCAVPGVYSTINLSASTSMGSCLYGLVPMSATLITAAPCTQSLLIS
jgi:hypothetical protein